MYEKERKTSHAEESRSLEISDWNNVKERGAAEEKAIRDVYTREGNKNRISDRPTGTFLSLFLKFLLNY